MERRSRPASPLWTGGMSVRDACNAELVDRSATAMMQTKEPMLTVVQDDI
jgi:hypothetical protein